MSVYILPAAVAFGGFVYFLFSALVAHGSRRRATLIERATAEIEEYRQRQARQPLSDRAKQYLLRHGWNYDLVPLVAIWTFGYILTGIVLEAVGLGQLFAALLAAPVTLWLAAMVLGRLSRQRRRRFTEQLLHAIRQLVAKIEGGSSPQRALEQIAPVMPDPLRQELSEMLEQVLATKDLVGGLRQLADKYPSRAMSMMVAAYEMDHDRGARIEPALRQAAVMLERQFELQAEAVAELSQTKMEFYGVVGIIGAIALGMVLMGPGSTAAAYKTLVGVIVLLASASWFSFGIFRARRIFARAKGDL